jgi:serine/threonine protein kinase
VMKEIRHAHLLAMFGSWRVSDFLVIAMELAEQTLLERLHTHQAKGLPGIPPKELLVYMEEAAKGLDHLNIDHRIQHRDIKPHNLLLVGGTVKVADFGLAKLLDSAQGSHSGSGQSFPYAAPEFFREQTTLTSDQYSLAITYCHLRGGKVPFMGSQAQIISGHLTLPPDLSMLPPEERPVVGRALAKIPQERWPSCKEFIAALRRCHELEPLPDPQPLSVLPGEISLPTPKSQPLRPRPLPPRPSGTKLPVPPPLPKHRRRPIANRRFQLLLLVLGGVVLALLALVLAYLLFKMLP